MPASPTTPRYQIHESARHAADVVVRIDQGDYLQLRGGFDWGRAESWEATMFDDVAAAERAIARCGCPARAIEGAE